MSNSILHWNMFYSELSGDEVVHTVYVLLSELCRELFWDKQDLNLGQDTWFTDEQMILRLSFEMCHTAAAAGLGAAVVMRCPTRW